MVDGVSVTPGNVAPSTVNQGRTLHHPRDSRRCLAMFSTVRHLTATIVGLNIPTLSHRKREARLRNTLKHANMRNAHLRKRTDLQIAKYVISTYLSGTAYELVMAQLVGSITKIRKRWSKNMRYCLSLYYKSPSTYRFLGNTFSIPSVRTLQKSVDTFQIYSEFSADLRSVLKKRVCTMSEKDILCNVCIDEMSLKCGFHYNVSKDRIDGFVNMDCGGSQEISKQALDFMATGLISNWKQPIGFLLVNPIYSQVGL